MTWKAHRYHDISCGHRVYGHESKCAHLHGHNYRIHFTCQAAAGLPGTDGLGRVIDFGEIKSRLCAWLEDNWDHKTLLWVEDPWASVLHDIDPTIVIVPFNPTAEHIAWYLVTVVAPEQLFGTGIQLSECLVEETRKCSASFHLDGRGQE